MVDADAGPGRVPGEQAGGGSQQIAGVHQDDASVHVLHLLSDLGPDSGSQVFRVLSSLPDRRGVDGRNWIFGVAERRPVRAAAALTDRNDPTCAGFSRV
ncbi:hypothetical protein GCM10017667_59580 [Streptomyces filamentosus]|uniref:Uncharacterized protein n=1 Tax=Streptomyces filamentosus TaxID=67294 RepID=A0A919BTJ5_STRFL|nr:hypothetical protein GCM10017667_59580 [Streptomyces filamentosus]